MDPTPGASLDQESCEPHPVHVTHLEHSDLSVLWYGKMDGCNHRQPLERHRKKAYVVESGRITVIVRAR